MAAPSSGYPAIDRFPHRDRRGAGDRLLHARARTHTHTHTHTHTTLTRIHARTHARTQTYARTHARALTPSRAAGARRTRCCSPSPSAAPAAASAASPPRPPRCVCVCVCVRARACVCERESRLLPPLRRHCAPRGDYPSLRNGYGRGCAAGVLDIRNSRSCGCQNHKRPERVVDTDSDGPLRYGVSVLRERERERDRERQRDR